MADGKDCVCGAYGESDCDCAADWTPQELIDARAEIARLRLTDEEREAVDLAADWLSGVDMPIAACSRVAPAAATLRSLLERLA